MASHNADFENVAVKRDTRKLIRLLAAATEKSAYEVIAEGVELFREKNRGPIAVALKIE